MAKFKHKNGGICEVFSLDNIEKLKKDKNYSLLDEKKGSAVTKKPKTEVEQPTEEIKKDGE